MGVAGACAVTGAGEDDGGSNGTGATGSGATGSGTGATSGTGTGAGATGAGATGAGGTVGVGGSVGVGGTVGVGGSVGVGGTVGAGGSTTNPPGSCGWSGVFSGPRVGRCVDAGPGCTAEFGCGYVTAEGGFLSVDNFEDTNLGIIAARDGRTGSWSAWPMGTSTATIADTSGSATRSTKALHFTGAGSTAAHLYVDVALCYNARIYDGIKFWIKGNPGSVKFNVMTPYTYPDDNGSGVCTDGCNDHFGSVINLPGAWQEVTLRWEDLVRPRCTETTPVPAIPEAFDPQSMIIGLSFEGWDPAQALDFWVDDVTFFKGTPSGDPAFSDMFTEAMFEEMFPTGTRDAFYTYAALVEAVGRCHNGTWNFCSGFAKTGTLDQRMQEIAAFLGQVRHETGTLKAVHENCDVNDTANGGHDCSAYEPYHGRGPIQLTHQINYQNAGNALGVNLLQGSGNPDLVSTNPTIAWGTALWFWNTQNGNAHNAIIAGNFGQTTRIINGIECDGAEPALVAARYSNYRDIAYAMGVMPYTTNTGC